MGNPHDILLARQMVPLLERGTEALRAKLATMPSKYDARAAIGIDVVTEEDFATEARLILRHVVHHGTPTHILCSNGSLCALLERLAPKW